MPRPTVDVVVPFRGTDRERAAVLAAMTRLALGPGDTLTVVDNGEAAPAPHPLVLHAPRVPTSYHARNEGARAGAADWLLFLDADVTPPLDLLDRYFAAPVGDAVGVLAGGIGDEPAAAARSLAARHTAARAPMAQEHTARRGAWAYAQTANAAVRRSAFEQAGGFAERARSGGDADLCFRLRALGWQLESRPAAQVTHRNRTSLLALVRQRARHGSGSAWLQARHPGSMPWRSPLGTTRARLIDAVRAGRAGDGEAAAFALVDVLLEWAFAAGRVVPNERRPRPRG